MPFKRDPRRVTQRPRRVTAPQAVVLGFAGVIALGTAALALPIAHAPGETVTVLDAAFTAVSAVCVTGLIVVDTPVAFSLFGEVVILLLIQLGGLGIMLVASLIGVTLARRMRLRSRIATATENRSVTLGDAGRLARGILLTSLLIEGLLAIVLSVRFALAYGYGALEAGWLGVFHAVSSFNNAGFSLFSDSMVGFATDPIIVLPMCVAIILGGLGFPVLLQLRKELRRPLHWSMNTNIVLSMSAVLLVAGTIWIAVNEWTNPDTIGSMSVADRVLVSFFHSVQTRTAGFNSVDIGLMSPETWLGMDILMFIGGGPAGTAGGIKVTTFAVLFFIILTELRGDGAVNIFGKRLSRAVHRQAITIALMGAAAVAMGTVALMSWTDRELGEVLFEATSAFGTVGLSTGITGDLPAGAEVLLMVLMFLGRLGPLTLGTALVLRDRRTLYELPKERPAIG
ncbi:MAG: TrkH family potassium uptake protein [Actinobacteria bacterium]|nr:TrkH family potassium uptake protein [Actinomycetota bacterium]MBU1608342.1 TrkH family potassium uptake protein [Actinomycetota bacterium]MBU2316846.1 TrkH family potassium uptake protein [Actinomycetota bacterium]MBU2385939.1 TrkH family potassium uptake protein [Actinomycetota bacterium]